MREFNYNCFEAQEKFIRLKSNNYNCYVDQKTYREIINSMSSGDYGSHKAFFVYVSTHKIDGIQLIQWDEENNGYWFQNKHDSWFENSL